VIEIPGYIIKGDISLGATASILLADQSSLDREVALKIMAPNLVGDKAHTQRFMQVARTLASFSHPNIVAVYDVGTTEEQAPYYSMQYLPGGDFMARAQQEMSEPDLTETLASIARAVGYIHQRGLVHRAIMPQNVLYDPYNTPVLIDFGVAPTPTQESFVTNTGFAVDVGRYMSPEQARGGEQDARSDIYSLGALTFLGLTGRPPYDGADGFAIAYAHVFEPIPRLPAAKAHWQPLIDCALAKDPKDRYASIEEFLDALTNVGLERDVALSVAPSPPPPAAPADPVPAAPVAQAVGPASAKVPEAIVIPEREPPPPAVVPAKVAAKQSAAPGKVPAPTSGLMRFWPLAVAALGLVLIAAALLLPKGAPESAMAPAPATTVPLPPPSAPASPSAEPATAGVAPKAASAGQSASPAEAAATPAGSAAPAAAGTTDTAQADAGRLPVLDAAEAQLEADAADPAKAPTVVDPLPESIRLGRIDLAGQRLIAPPGKNALERFQFALSLDPKSRGAKQGIVDIAKKYIELADKAGGDKAAGGAALAAYAEQLDHASDVAKLVPEGADVLKDVAARRHKAAEPLLAQAKASADKWDKPAAKAAYEEALKIDPDSTAARDGLKFVATIGEPGFVFRDKLGDAGAPPMVVLPGAGIAMARHPVTRAEFRRFWDSGGRAEFSGKEPSCRDRESIFRSSKKRGWENPDITQDDSHPVVCVGWAEAAAYAQWLGKQTGKRYRLPTAAEFDQVAARAARGDCSTSNLADAAFNKQFDSRDGGACDDGFAATAPVEHFAPVEGVYDIDGNVREWVSACGNGSAAAPGSSCRDFRVKGRGWLSSGAKEAATATDTYAADVSLNTVGFRVVRDMSN
jgi:formylglycine-generating enzyme required for sulfatase activity/tRNA A-37 threonylcarbamoyl transferase component Bud32